MEKNSAIKDKVMTQFEKNRAEKNNHLGHILFNLIAERILKCPKCGYPYKEGYICVNCGADNSGNEEEYPLDELIDIMQAEPVSEDLKEEITRYFNNNPIKYLTDWPALKNTALHFANWQRELMLKDAVDANVSFGQPVLLAKPIPTNIAKDGDKVKLIIVKDD